MSNEERKSDPAAPSNGESWTLDNAPVPEESPEERLTRDLNETAQGVTAGLDDLREELEPQGQVEDAFAAEAKEDQPAGVMPAGEVPRSAAEGEVVPGESLPPLPPPAAEGSGAGTPPQRTYTPEGSDDDRLMSGLAWLSMVILQLPIVSVIQLMSPNNRERAFQRHHAVTSLLFFAAAIVYEIIAALAFTILTIVTAGCLAFCLWIIFLAPHGLGLYYAYQAYMGKRVELPWLSDLGRRQGWL